MATQRRGDKNTGGTKVKKKQPQQPKISSRRVSSDFVLSAEPKHQSKRKSGGGATATTTTTTRPSATLPKDVVEAERRADAAKRDWFAAEERAVAARRDAVAASEISSTKNQTKPRKFSLEDEFVRRQLIQSAASLLVVTRDSNSSGVRTRRSNHTVENLVDKYRKSVPHLDISGDEVWDEVTRVTSSAKGKGAKDDGVSESSGGPNTGSRRRPLKGISNGIANERGNSSEEATRKKRSLRGRGGLTVENVSNPWYAAADDQGGADNKEETKDDSCELPANKRRRDDLGSVTNDIGAEKNERSTVTKVIVREVASNRSEFSSSSIDVSIDEETDTAADNVADEIADESEYDGSDDIADKNIDDDATASTISCEGGKRTNDGKQKVTPKTVSSSESYADCSISCDKNTSAVVDDRANGSEDNSEGNCGGEPDPIDEHDADEPRFHAAYVREMYDHFRTKEDLLHRYMNQHHQPHITARMRSILVDWLVEVHTKFRLVPETLYLAVSIVDRYLATLTGGGVVRSKLQLVGAAALWTASKYEEIYPIELRDAVYICDRAYTREEFIEMEFSILNSLMYKLTVPSAHSFLVRYLKAAHADKTIVQLSCYVLDGTLLSYDLLRFKPSELAAAAVLIARRTAGRNSWSPTLREYAGYSFDETVDVARALLLDKDAPHLNLESSAVRKKYTNVRYGRVANTVLATDF